MTLLGRDIASDDAKQRGLAGAIPTDKADPCAAWNARRSALQQWAASNADSEIVDNEHAAPFGRQRGAKQPLRPQASVDLVQPALAGFSLVNDQIETWCQVVAGDRRQQRMGLAPMVGLMIEKMVKRGGQHLLYGLWVNHGAKTDRFGQVLFTQGTDVSADAFVFEAARGTQLREVVKKDCVEARWCLTLAGEASHPDTIADEQMVERAVQRFKENTAVGAVVSIGNLCRSLVEPFVAPGVIAGEHLIAGQHIALPVAKAADLAA